MLARKLKLHTSQYIDTQLWSYELFCLFQTPRTLSLFKLWSLSRARISKYQDWLDEFRVLSGILVKPELHIHQIVTLDLLLQVSCSEWQDPVVMEITLPWTREKCLKWCLKFGMVSNGFLKCKLPVLLPQAVLGPKVTTSYFSAGSWFTAWTVFKTKWVSL